VGLEAFAQGGAQTPLLIVAAVFAATAVAALLITSRAQTPAQRLARYAVGTRAVSPGAYAETTGVAERLVVPVGQRLADLLGRLAPPRMHRATAAQLTMAGMSTSPTAFLAFRTVLLVGLPLTGLWQFMRLSSPAPTDWAMLAASVLLGRRLPDMFLKRRIRARQRAIDRELPYALDLMVACLEGGLSLDASLAKVSEQSDGPLAEVVRNALQEMTLGRPAAEAVRAMGERAGAPELKRFSNTIVQAERMGVGIAGAMRTLAAESRVRRRQRAEESARKAPIKMIPVLICCVFPSLMIVVLGPAVLMVSRLFQVPR
jgi:tight adherence protein C